MKKMVSIAIVIVMLFGMATNAFATSIESFTAQNQQQDTIMDEIQLESNDIQINPSVIDADGNATINGDYLLVVNTSKTQDQQTSDLSSLYADNRKNIISQDLATQNDDIYPIDYHPQEKKTKEGKSFESLANTLQKETDFATYTKGMTKQLIVDNDILGNYYKWEIFNAKAAYVGTNCVIWVHDNSKQDAFTNKETRILTDLQAQNMGKEFDKHYQTMNTNFGNHMDVDNSGKVSVLVYDIQDGFTGSGGYIAGYFASYDLINYSNTPPQQVPLVHIDTYPSIFYYNTTNFNNAYSTLFHEYQHMINFSVGYTNGRGGPLDTYINEMMSMSVEQMLGYDAKASRLSYYNSNFPATGLSLTDWKGSLDNYSLSFLLGQYLVAQTGDCSVFSKMINSRYSDERSMTEALAKTNNPLKGLSFEQILYNFYTSLALNEAEGISGFKGSSINVGEIAQKLYPMTSSTRQITLKPTSSILLNIKSGTTVSTSGKGANIKYYGIKAGKATIDNNASGIPDKALYDALLNEVSKIQGKPVTEMYADDLKNLSELQLNHVDGALKIASLTGLDKMNFSSLEKLMLDGHSISDLTPLSKSQTLNNLKELSLQGNNISNITALSKFTSLESLNIGENLNLSILTPISKLINLKQLSVNSTRVTSLSAIAGLTNLLSLDISYCTISDVRPLSNFINLEELIFAYNKSTTPIDMKIISSLTKLTSLYLSGSTLKDPFELSKMVQLINLQISSCKLTDLSFLPQLTKLEMLVAKNNYIVVLPNIKALTLLNKSRTSFGNNYINPEYLTDNYLPPQLLGDATWLAMQGQYTLEPATAISISPTTLSLTAYEVSAPIAVTVKPDYIASTEVVWELSNTNVATVDSLGRVTGVSKGTAYITATTPSGKTAKCTVTVKNIPITAVGIGDNFTLETDQTRQIVASITPENANEKTVTWTSSNPKVAVVDPNGLVTALSSGTATITATTLESSKRTSCVVTVSSNPTKIILNESFVSLKNKASFQLSAKVYPTDIIKPVVEWYVGDATGNPISQPTAVTVDSKGKITANAIGDVKTAYVWAKYNDVKACCYVSVFVPVSGISFDNTPTKIDLLLNSDESLKTIKLDTIVSPENANNKAVVWSSSNPKVATVNSSGLVTAVSKGTVRITAKTVDSGRSVSTNVVVSLFNPLTSLLINEKAAVLYANSADNTKELSLTAKTATETIAPYPTNKATWKSSNNKVAVVSESGIVTAIGKGSATITATARDGSLKSATSKIMVNKYVEEIALSATATGKVDGIETYEANIAQGKSMTIKATAYPVDANTKTFTWTADPLNNNGVTVSSTGVVKVPLTAVGSAVFYVTAKDGSGVYSKLTIHAKAPAKTVGITKTNPADINLAESFNMDIGKISKLSATVKDAAGLVTDVSQTVLWTSSSPKVVAIHPLSGEIIAVGKGVATITATTQDGSNVKATQKITVNVPVEAIDIPTDFIYLKASTTATAKANVLPASANNKAITWSITNNEHIFIDAKTGKITLSKVPVIGTTATITATSVQDSSIKDTCVVEIVETPVSSITLNLKTVDVVGISNTVNLTATILPTTATRKDVVWSSSDNNIATVVDGVVTTTGFGKATITCATQDGLKKATCLIYVYPIGKRDRIYPTQSVFNLEMKSIYANSSGQINIMDQNATPINPSLFTFTSSNPAVAQVDANGKITPADSVTKQTKVTVTATLTGDMSRRKVTFTVNVLPERQVKRFGIYQTSMGAESLITAPIKMEFYSGKKIYLNPIAFDSNNAPFEAKAPRWAVSNRSLAQIKSNPDGSAVVTIMKAGQFNVIATAQDVAKNATVVSVISYDFTPVITTKTIQLSKSSQPTGDNNRSSLFEIQTQDTQIDNITNVYVNCVSKYYAVSHFNVVTVDQQYAIEIDKNTLASLPVGSYTLGVNIRVSGGDINAVTGYDNKTKRVIIPFKIVK